MCSFASEEPPKRKAIFSGCVLVETLIPGSSRWLLVEERMRYVAPKPAKDPYITEKKSMFSWPRQNKGLAQPK